MGEEMREDVKMWTDFLPGEGRKEGRKRDRKEKFSRPKEEEKMVESFHE